MPKLVYKDPYIRVPQWHERVPQEVEPFEYKTPRTKRMSARFDQPEPKPEEFLAGYVHGVRASALEERFARALDFFGLDYRFQFEVPSIYSLPGQEKTIDFLVYDGGIAFPIEIGSRFVHASPSEQEKERERTAQMNAVLPTLGIMQITDDSYIPLDRPTSVEDAKDIVARLFYSV